jgi:hypothetical protein
MIGRASSENDVITNACRNTVEKLKEWNHYEDIGVNGKMI